MSPDTYAALFLIAVAVGCVLPSLRAKLRRINTAAEQRRLNRDIAALDARIHGPSILPLPAPNAPDAEFDTWVAQAIANSKPHPFAETARQIRALPEVSA